MRGFSIKIPGLFAGGVLVLLILHLIVGGRIPWLINMACFTAGFIPFLFILINRKSVPLIWIAGPLSVLCFLGGLELGLRVGIYRDRFHPLGVGKLYSPHPLLFWNSKPTDRILQFDSPEEYQSEWKRIENEIDRIVDQQTMTTDFRSGPIEMKKTQGAFRIMTMGGSNAYGYRIENYEDTFSAILDDKLQKEYPNRKIEVIAAGQPGYCAFQNLVYYKIALRNYEPDVILLYANVNELFEHLGPYSYREYFKKRSGVDIGRLWIDRFELSEEPDWIIGLQDRLQKFHTYNLAVKAITGIRNESGLYRVGNGLLKEVNPVDDYRKNLEDLIRITKKDGVEVIFADAFYFPHTLDDLQKDEKNLIRKTMAEVAEKNDIPFVPVHEMLSNSENPNQLIFEFDTAHLNEEGHRRVADILFETIQYNHLIDPK